MLSNRELSICNNMRKIFNNDKNFHGFFGVFMCLAGNEDENRKHLFIEVYGCCGPYK